MSTERQIAPEIRERLIRDLRVVCGEASDGASLDLKGALADLDDIAAQEESLPPHLLHQLRKRSYGKALHSLQTEK